MRAIALLLAAATLGALELIQFIGAGVDPARPRWFDALTGAMDLGLVASGALLGPILLRRGRRRLGLLFAANLPLMAGAALLRLSGVEFGRPLLFGVGLYWINLYLVGLATSWRAILGPTTPAVSPASSCP